MRTPDPNPAPPPTSTGPTLQDELEDLIVAIVSKSAHWLQAVPPPLADPLCPWERICAPLTPWADCHPSPLPDAPARLRAKG